MSGKLRVRVYDVKFGDAILVTVPPEQAGDPPTHLLVDVGNAPFGEGSDKAVYLPIVEDVLAELGGRPLHLYVSTHEHMDHVQGLFHAAKDLRDDTQRTLADELKVERVWLTASADPDYAATHPDAKKKLDFHLAFYDGLADAEKRLGRSMLPARFEAMAANNNPRSTKQCVDYVRGLPSLGVTYLHRGVDADAAHALPGVSVRVLAPEEDTSVYYGRTGGLTSLWLDDDEAASRLALAVTPESRLPAAPAGVDATAFRTLWEIFRDGPLTDALLQIDKAENNTSVVFELTWKGWKLLFAGDAEERSWAMMRDAGVLAPVHFLKVSHHGSHNGTPDDAILEAVLPMADRTKPRIAVVSTCANTYGGIPHAPTDQAIKARCSTFRKTSDGDLQTAPGGARYFDVFFDPAGPS